jgi:hypothetical protein
VNSGVLSRASSLLTGWVGESFWSRIAYFLILLSSLISGGGRIASTSIGKIGAVLKTPNIFLRAKFWRAWSGFLSWGCPFHQIGEP